MSIENLYKIYLKFPSICIDSRKAKKNSLFFALQGNNLNGNRFADNAIKNGCSYAIIDNEKYISKHCILVKNVLETLQELARYHRKQLNIPIIGITGTNGKTTSKELINVVLKSQLNITATTGNMNNHIGVPLTLLEIGQDDDMAIIEMGANHKNEIDSLCRLAMPNYGVITNIGKAHLEGFGDIKNITETKLEMYKYIYSKNNKIFVNHEDDLLMKKSSNINRVTYGKQGDCTGNIINDIPFMNLEYEDRIINSNLIGDYQFYNIMLAICIGRFFDININNIKKSIENYVPKNNRSQLLQTNDNTLILDAYNANPSSMQSMLKAFSKQKQKDKLCILGDMLELGDSSENEHRNIKDLTKKLKLKTIFVGKEFLKINKDSYKNADELCSHLENKPIKNKCILLKGSRGIALEKLIDLL